MNIRDKPLEERQQIIGIYFKGIEEKLYLDNIRKDYESKKQLVVILKKLEENYSEINNKLRYRSEYTLDDLNIMNGYKLEFYNSICIEDIYLIYEDNTTSESIEDIVSLDRMIDADSSLTRTLCYWKCNNTKINIEASRIYKYIRNQTRDFVTIIIKLDCDTIY